MGSVGVPVGVAVGERSARLERARALLESASRGGRSAHGRVGGAAVERAEAGGGRILPVSPPLRPLFADGGLRRGTTVELGRSPALVLALLAEASAGGAWCAVVGLPRIGLVAAAESGVELSRLALVHRPGAELAAVSAALLDGLDLVVVAVERVLPAGVRQRLTARARQAGSVLLAFGPWPGADLRVDVQGGRWHGLTDPGEGRLRHREVHVRGSGRGGAQRRRWITVMLPGPAGRTGDRAGQVGGMSVGGLSAGGSAENPVGGLSAAVQEVS